MILDTTSILSGIATAMFVAGRATCGQVHAAYPKVYTTRAYPKVYPLGQRPLGKAFVCSQRTRQMSFRPTLFINILR